MCPRHPSMHLHVLRTKLVRSTDTPYGVSASVYPVATEPQVPRRAMIRHRDHAPPTGYLWKRASVPLYTSYLCMSVHVPLLAWLCTSGNYPARQAHVFPSHPDPPVAKLPLERGKSTVDALSYGVRPPHGGGGTALITRRRAGEDRGQRRGGGGPATADMTAPPWLPRQARPLPSRTNGRGERERGQGKAIVEEEPCRERRRPTPPSSPSPPCATARHTEGRPSAARANGWMLLRLGGVMRAVLSLQGTGPRGAGSGRAGGPVAAARLKGGGTMCQGGDAGPGRGGVDVTPP